MDWTNIPSHILENIFSYFSTRELLQLSLVCRNWYEEIGKDWDNELQCCSFDKGEHLEELVRSRRQFRSIRVCNTHMELAHTIVSVIGARKLRKPSNVLKIEVNGLFYTSNTPFSKVVELLNRHGDHLKNVTLSGLNDEDMRLGYCGVSLKGRPNVRHFEIGGILDLTERSFALLYNAYVHLTSLTFNRTKGLSQYNIVQNFVLNNAKSLVYLNVELEIDAFRSNLLFESLNHLKHLKSCTLTLCDRSDKLPLDVDILRNNSNLQMLLLKGFYISNEDMYKLPHYFPALTHLRIYLDTHVDEHSLRVIGGLPTLTSIELVFDSRFPSWFEDWFNYCNKNLRTLKILGCRQFYDFFVLKSLQDKITYASNNPLTLDNILINLNRLEHLSIKLSSLKLVNPNELDFPTLKSAILEDCNPQGNAYDFFKRFKTSNLITLKSDLLGMTDESVAVLLGNLKNLKNLYLTSEDKLGVRAMQYLAKANLEKMSCYNMSFEMGIELLKNSKYLQKADLFFNIPQMDAGQRIRFEKEHKDVVMTANAFDHKKAHEFLDDICQVFTSPLEKSLNQGWVVGSNCYRTYFLYGNCVSMNIQMKFNSFLENDN